MACTETKNGTSLVKTVLNGCLIQCIKYFYSCSFLMIKLNFSASCLPPRNIGFAQCEVASRMPVPCLMVLLWPFAGGAGALGC